MKIFFGMKTILTSLATMFSNRTLSEFAIWLIETADTLTTPIDKFLMIVVLWSCRE